MSPISNLLVQLNHIFCQSICKGLAKVSANKHGNGIKTKAKGL